MYDFADETPELVRLIEGLEAFNAGIVGRYLDIGVDVMGYAEDLGMQHAPMLSPAHYRKYILPSCRRLMKPARDRGVVIHMHSDGHLHALIDDILDGGVDVINLQDLVNGVDWIASRFAGRTCVELDIDRQSVTVFGTPADVDRLVRDEVRALGSKRGGLLMVYGLYPGTPLANVAALMDAMERYASYFR
jgi:uroporphyrinogen-III decarboxylase